MRKSRGRISLSVQHLKEVANYITTPRCAQTKSPHTQKKKTQKSISQPAKKNGSQRRRIFIPRRVCCALIFGVDSPPPSAKLAALTGPRLLSAHGAVMSISRDFAKKPRAENENAESIRLRACNMLPCGSATGLIHTLSYTHCYMWQKQQVLRAKTN